MEIKSKVCGEHRSAIFCVGKKENRNLHMHVLIAVGGIKKGKLEPRLKERAGMGGGIQTKYTFLYSFTFQLVKNLHILNPLNL